jgi:hypothetical protein
MVTTALRPATTKPGGSNLLLLFYLRIASLPQDGTVDQLTLALTIHKLANRITDSNIRREIQNVTSKAASIFTRPLARA